MAGFVENIGRPESVTGSNPVHESAGALIGGALQGAASLLEVGLKAGAKYREDQINSELEEKLAENTKQWGPNAQAPKFIGDPQDSTTSAMESAPGINQGLRQIESWRQSNQQGRASTAEFMGRSSTIVQQMIHDHPRFADAIRERAQKILGTNPTAEMIKLNQEDEAANDRQAREVQMGYVKHLVDAGGQLVLNSDGSPDWARSSSMGQMVAHSEFQMGLDMKNAELERVNLENDKIKHPPMTQEERNHQQQTLIERNIDPIFNTSIHNMQIQAARLDAVDFGSLSAKDQADFQTNVINNINTMSLSIDRMIDTTIAKLDPADRTADNVKAVKEYYHDQMKPYLDRVQKDPSNYQQYVHLVDKIKAVTKLNFGEVAPGVSQAMDIFGPNTGDAMAALFFQRGTPMGDAAAKEMFQGLQYLMKVGQGQSTAGLYDPTHGQAAAAVIKTWNDHPENIAKLDPNVYTNMVSAVADTGIKQQGDPKAIQGAVNLLSGAGSMAAFDQFAANKANADKVQDVATTILNVNQQNINTQGHNIATFTSKNQLATAPAPAGKPQKDNGLHGLGRVVQGAIDNFGNVNNTPLGTVSGQRTDVTYSAEYNPASGRVEMTVTDSKGNDLSRSPQLVQSAPADLQRQVKGINQSLGVLEHLQPYGGDRVKAMKTDQFKLLSVATSGIKVKGGVVPPSMEEKPEAPKKEEKEAPVKKENTAHTTDDGWSFKVIE